MKNIHNIWNKTTTYYLLMITVAVFIIVDCIVRGPLSPILITIDELRIKYILMAITALFLLMVLIARKRKLFKGNIFVDESKYFLCAIGLLVIITLYYQIRNGFRAFAISEFMYLLIPLLFVILVVSDDTINITRVLDNCFYIVLISFILSNIDIFSFSSLKSISFWDSTSPFENGYATMFVCFELYFLVRYGRRNGKSFVCLLFAILSFKRLSVIKAILFFIIVPMIKNKKVPRWLLIITIIFFCALPFLLVYIYSYDFANLMIGKYGIKLNEITMDRYRRTMYVLANTDQIKYGYGSVTYFLTNTFGKGEFANRSLHSDILRIYLECSIFGSIAYTICNFMAVRKNIISFLLMLHIFIEMIVNHPIGAGGVGYWILIYMMIVYFNYRKEVPFYREGNLKRKRFKLGKIIN